MRRRAYQLRKLRGCRRASTLVLSVLLGVSGAAPALSQSTASIPTHHAARRTAPRNASAAPEVAQEPLSQQEQAAQVLNRFTFGPRPGEVSAVAQLGWETWFDQQLNPATIPDTAVEKRLAQYPALQLAPAQLAIQYPDGQVIRRIADGKLAMPQDPQLAGVYEVLLARYQRKQAEDKAAALSSQTLPIPSAAVPLKAPTASVPGASSKAVASAPTASPAAPASALVARGTPATSQQAASATTVSPAPAAESEKQQQKQQERTEARMLADQILGYPKNLRMQAIFKLPVEQRLVLTSGIGEPEKGMLTGDLNPREKELFGMMTGGYAGSGVIGTEMQQAKILRAVMSERQLQEIMTDFWINHFNIDLGKSGDELDYAPSYERDAIRAHSLGKFRDLLLATAEHPAMLIYLDNWLSIGPDSQAAGRPKPGAKAQQRGLNENYGREVMELHTVGVDGGYTQADVTSLAEILTGWTVDQPQMGGGFLFEPRKHEPGAKRWFGQNIEYQPGPNGVHEGVAALSFLAAQPQTAHFLSYELAQRFVADVPPPALVSRMASAYMGSDGDISTVLRTMVHSPEFFSRSNYRNKVKMPLEYVASSLRATGTDPGNPGALANELKTMGEPLYRCLTPTGYAATADHWMNSAALVDRLNYALNLTSGHFGGMRFDAPRLLAAGLLARSAAAPKAAPTAHAVTLRSAADVPSGQEEALLLMERLLVPASVSEKTNAVIRQQLAQSEAGNTASPAATLSVTVPAAMPQLPDPNEALDKLSAMILGSPEFQVH